MELLAALLAFLIGGALAGAVANLAVGGADLVRLWRAAHARISALGTQPTGLVTLRGRAWPLDRMLPALTRAADGCLAYASRSGFAMSRDHAAIAFDLCDGTGMARIDPERAHVVGPEAQDIFGSRTREIHPGDEIVITGVARVEADPGAPFDSYRRPPTRLVVHAAPGAPLLIVRLTRQPLMTVAKGAGALVAAGFGLWLILSAFG
jgi:hypothetical protein